jgi:hypothetical protein
MEDNEKTRSENMNLTQTISSIVHRVNPTLGNIYDKYALFWNDGIVGFVIGVPLTFLFYYPIAPFISFSIFGIDLSWLVQFLWYIICAFFSFCIQHYLRKSWVFTFKKKGVTVEKRNK